MKHQITLSEDEVKVMICKHIRDAKPENITFHAQLLKSVDNECTDVTVVCEWEENKNEGIDNSWAW